MANNEWSGLDAERCRDRPKKDSDTMRLRESRCLVCALHIEPANPAAPLQCGCRLADARLRPLHSWSLPPLSAAHQLAEHQDTALGASVLDRRAHEPINQFLEIHLTRDCLRDFDHRR